MQGERFRSKLEVRTNVEVNEVYELCLRKYLAGSAERIGTRSRRRTSVQGEKSFLELWIRTCHFGGI